MDARDAEPGGARQRAPLLSTKLHVPQVRPGLVPRPRLVARLREAGERCLALLSAPAGYGKTTLVAEWLRDAALPFAWLSLDEHDNDVARFNRYLLAALQSVEPGIGQSAQAMLRAPQPPPPEVFLASVINDVASAPRPLVLVLDDYHLVQTLPIHQELAFLLDHQPASLHLVILTREDPPVPLSRCRASGQMVEVRQADLAFTADEALDFLRRVMGLDVSPADAAALHRRTEGWIAGLQLAALSLRGREDVQRLVQSFAGSSRYVLDYLVEEVLQRQPADVQDFLLATSVLDRLAAPLCDAVTQRDDGQRMLRALEHANLFVVPLDRLDQPDPFASPDAAVAPSPGAARAPGDDARQWYRYHHLFADLLRHRLQTTRRSEVAALHRRASDWHEANGFPHDAVRHALAARDWGHAAALVHAATGDLLRRGEVATLLGWFGSLPAETVRASAALCLDYAWPLLLLGRLDAAESLLEQAGQLGQDDRLRGELAAAAAYLARARGDFARTVETSRRALALLPAADLVSRGVVAVNLGVAHWQQGELAEAESALAEAERAGRRSGNEHATLTARLFQARTLASQGKLHRAAELLGWVARQGGPSPTAGLAHLDLAALHYEWHDLATAARHLGQSLRASELSGQAEYQAASYRLLARLKLGAGDPAAALAAIERCQQLARDADLPAAARARSAAGCVEVALARGDLELARRWAAEAGDGADAHLFYPFLGLAPARLLLAAGGKVAAAAALATAAELASRAGWGYGLVAVRVLQALAARTTELALGYLTDALAWSQSEGFVGTFADAGPGLAPLLQEAARRGVAPERVGQLREAIAERAAPPSGSPLAEPLAEPLTEREVEVLRLLAAGLSNREIAEQLVVSLGTVKTHVHHLCAKLGVGSRTRAIARARELRLV